ncbi:MULTISPECIES: TonB-dependent receptor [Dyadobacter]|uniref:TonB-dependent receptor n=1 Tax=Dyadobacter chenhuakuii TaxID=2909339 RepID=A0ABY4XF20_9BACT|nr:MULTISPECIES: TonB-dependent receptor [Dyadobacter]MCF2491994.1 TonB-dependent receptor [Dyadobacter chenhuakuii]MCF2516631.1 TonB-dependent receptor [Dyadobacter sp. CY351]USJ28845.1 TonB-dependent receptor [Dyadobacter chenhuakuii]
MKKNLLLAMLCLLSTWMSVYGQSVQITGKVTTDSDDAPLPGATVQIKGSTIGTQTDADGNYTISAPSSSSVIIFSFVGLTAQEVTVGSRSVIDVKLSTDTRSLSEVVVTGFGSQIKRDLTGNIAQVKGTEIQNMPVASVDAALQGRAAGVYVNSGSGKLGQAINVRIRGNSSISASSQPLYVVDGMPITTSDLSSSTGGATNPLSDINSNDIESIEILKDASAGSIYGSRAANGVVLITTKRGKAGKTNVSINYQQGSSEATRRVQFLNADEYVRFYTAAALNSDRIDEYDPSDPESNTAYFLDNLNRYSLGTANTPQQKNYPWQDQAFTKGGMQQLDFQLNGGNDKTKFFLSGQYLDQKGTIIGNELDRLSTRMNLDHQASNWLQVGLSMGLARTVNKRLPGDNSFSNPLQMSALTPLTPFTDPETGLPIGTPPGDVNLPLYFNPMISVKYSNFTATSFRNLTNAYAQINILPSLKFRTELGVDLLNQNEESYYQSQNLRNVDEAVNGLGENFGTFVTNYNTNNFFTFDKVFDIHSISATLGMSYQDSQTKENFIAGTQFPSNSYKKIASAATKSDGSSTETNYRFLSYFLRFNYKLSERYLLAASARIDGSSRFGANSRYGFFPSVSAGWVLTEENFLKENNTLSFLKLRGSYGSTGNSEIGDFPQLGLFSGDAGYGGAAGQRPSQLANPNLKWETTKQADIGLDFGLFNNRINGEIDYYIKKTNGLLLEVNVPATSGFAIQVANVGKLENKGFEFVLNTQNIVGAFKWTTSFNIANNKNKVTNIQKQIIEGGISNMSRVMEGEAVGVFYTVEYAGVDKANGDALFYKNTEEANGNIDRSTTSSYNSARRVVAGNPNPKFVGGITNTFSYKGLDLTVFLNGVAGNKINFYGVGQYASANGIYEDNQTVDQLNSWTPQNTDTNVPEARFYKGNGNEASTRYIYDGSYLRLRTMTLGYNLPSNIVSRIKMDRVRVYVSAMNLATWTNYKGWDPEVSTDDIPVRDLKFALGNDFYTPPQPRTLLFGVNIGF